MGIGLLGKQLQAEIIAGLPLQFQAPGLLIAVVFFTVQKGVFQSPVALPVQHGDAQAEAGREAVAECRFKPLFAVFFVFIGQSAFTADVGGCAAAGDVEDPGNGVFAE